MTRYRASITLVIEYDADNKDDAQKIAENLANAASVPTPTGRGAELTKVRKSVVNV